MNHTANFAGNGYFNRLTQLQSSTKNANNQIPSTMGGAMNLQINNNNNCNPFEPTKLGYTGGEGEVPRET
jgi:hypothetical protein